ncbi:receptor-like protein 30 [Corylus avellana]|uniref:receptor-like protein 30 n=1 Tax=Corylus avellana TaxID=13451 RepID=UPI00286CF145|nr:receptor-like protein 30 [Corylus avellana]
MQPFCHEDESSALLQFKDTFIINKSASGYPKVASWTLEGGNISTDCCSWDGVECDEDMGRVVGLDISSSCLYGSINSSNSLFRLVQLRRLNLANNHFNYSQIPFGFGNLTRLTYLNLSASSFSGQIPSEVSHLSELSSLDLSSNDHLYAKSLQVLVQNLTNLEELRLSFVNLPSTVPDILANFSTLTTLQLRNCGLYGDFPTKMFQLPNLKDLRVGFNQDLTGYLPEFHSSNSLRALGLKATNFFGKLPTSIGNLTFLNILDISDSNFSGSIPPSLSNLTKLHYLDLSHNNLQGQIPSSLPVNLNHVTFLGLANNYLQGTIPSSFSKLKNVECLDLSGNDLIGEISPWICNMSLLSILDFSHNSLSGVLHPCFSNFSQFLQVLHLRSNNFHGTIPKSWAKESSLRMIDLSQNQLKGQLPRSLAKCTMLEYLHVGGNQINDTFPFWLGTLPELKVLVLHSNGFNGIIRCPGTNYTFPKLRIIDLSLNDFSGNLPTSCFLHWDAMKTIEANQLIYLNASVAGDGWRSGDIKSLGFLYSVTVANKGLNLDYKKIQDVFKVIDFSSNRFEGEIPELLGSLKGLHLLNLSNNTLTGHIPSSLGNLTHGINGPFPKQVGRGNTSAANTTLFS